jgi:hypothetical protein
LIDSELTRKKGIYIKYEYSEDLRGKLNGMGSEKSPLFFILPKNVNPALLKVAEFIHDLKPLFWLLLCKIEHRIKAGWACLCMPPVYKICSKRREMNSKRGDFILRKINPILNFLI